MKSAEEYIVRLYITDDGEPKCVHDTVENVLETIKIAQRDAIDEAVKMCANDVILVENVAVCNSPTADDSKFGRNYDFYIDKQSILQVADKLKQEIG